MANAFFYSNNAQQTTLSGSISAGALSVSVGATTGFPGSFPYILALDYGAATEELVSVTAAAGTTLTVTRGYGGTSAQSHSLGAVVRHTYNAQDATDFRTHEAATAAIHGVAGTLVGTSDTQVLSNKTLTSPTVNGALFTGNPVFEAGLAATIASSHRVTADTTPRLQTQADGKLLWGPGNAAADTNLYRSGADTLTTDDLMRSVRTATGDAAFSTRVGAEANARWYVQADGFMNWGPGGASSTDTTLFRSGVGALTTGGDFNASGTLTASPSSTAKDGLSTNLPTATVGDLLNLRVNSSIQAAMGSDGAFRIYQGNSGIPFTPTVAGGGTVTWTTRTGLYFRIGKMIFVKIYLSINAAGSGASIFTVDMPTSVERTTRQVLTVHAESTGPNGSHIGGGEAVFFTGGSGGTADRIRIDEGAAVGREQNLTGADLLAGGVITIQGWYLEA